MRGRACRRRGFSILEVQVAFILLGIGVAGVCPLVIIQVKLARRVAAGFEQNGWLRPVDANEPARRTYLVAPAERWSRKLGATASLSATPGGSVAAASASRLTVVAPVAWAIGAESVEVRVKRAVNRPLAVGGATP